MTTINTSPPPGGLLAPPYHSLSLVGTNSSNGGGSSNRLSSCSATTSITTPSPSISVRKWDDPPELPPDFPSENATTIVFTRGRRLQSFFGREIQQLCFSGSDAHLVARVSKFPNALAVSADTDHVSTLFLWDFPSGTRITMREEPDRGFRAQKGFALSSGAEIMVACAFRRNEVERERFDEHRSMRTVGGGPPRLEVLDLAGRKRRFKANLPIQAPLAWSGDGRCLAAVSTRDPSRVVVVDVSGGIKGKETKIERVIAGHVGEVTHLAFTPDGTEVVTAAKDGSMRLTSVYSGRTLRKIELEAKCPPSMMQVSPDGESVATVWGRQVFVWQLRTGRLSGYSLDMVRHTDGFPLAISPDCRYLACRTDDGFDVVKVESGQFCGEFAVDGPLITAAAFSHSGNWIAVGRYDGEVGLFEVNTGS